MTKVTHAIILCGGLSRRMGTPKQLLRYYGTPLYRHAYEALSSCVDTVFFSLPNKNLVAQDSAVQTIVADGFPCVYDTSSMRCGPMGGILSAFNTASCPWLVFAVDMPNITQTTINAFVARRAAIIGTDAKYDAYVASVKNKPFVEPLFAVYEPSIMPAIKTAFSQEEYSLQKLLYSSGVAVRKITVSEQSVQNINTPEEYKKAVHNL